VINSGCKRWPDRQARMLVDNAAIAGGEVGAKAHPAD
jgi:hypothetical protein